MQHIHHCSPKTWEAKQEPWQSWGDSALQSKARHAQHVGVSDHHLPPHPQLQATAVGYWANQPLGLPKELTLCWRGPAVRRRDFQVWVSYPAPGYFCWPCSGMPDTLGCAPQKAQVLPAAWGHSRGHWCQTNVAQEEGCWALVSEG